MKYFTFLNFSSFKIIKPGKNVFHKKGNNKLIIILKIYLILFSFLILSSCKTCKCPAYSFYELSFKGNNHVFTNRY